MKKRNLILGMMMAVCMMSSITASAAIDMSVFESKPDLYEVEIDDFDDTGTITLLEDEDAYDRIVEGKIKEYDGDEFSYSYSDLIYVTFNIRIINDGELAIPRISLIYYGEDWIFTDTVIIKDDEKRFTFEVDAATDTYNGKVFEGMELVLGENGIQLLEQIEKEYERKVEEYKDETDMDVKELLTNYFILDGRLSGSSGDRDFSFVVNSASKIVEFYNDFVEAGGLEQDLSVVEGEFPCTVKEM